MEQRFHSNLSEVDGGAWDKLTEETNPFVQRAFLETLENCGAASTDNGWQPRHLTMYRDGMLCGAVPLYRKIHSWGEFVFDWSWAHAAEDAGIPYYPKLLAAVPFTPVTGPRLLTGSHSIRDQLTHALIQEAKGIEVSGVHVNFVEDNDCAALLKAGFILREDIQFHWRNCNYTDFQNFLDALTHKRRKAIRHERSKVFDQDITFVHKSGAEANALEWQTMHELYENTFWSKGNPPVFSADCFHALGKALGASVLLIFAYKDDRIIAGALYLRGPNTLYGRYWGATEHIPWLHFETCYYQGIEYCIENGIKTFEPGAQGEHKMLRGFMPVVTRSCHWLKDPRLHRAIGDAMERERLMIRAYKQSLDTHSPYRDLA